MYNLNEDKCLKCEGTYYVSADQTTCTGYPDGVIGCTAYAVVDTKRVCIACNGLDYFLKDGSCVKVTDKDANCLVVRAEKDC